MAAVTQTIPTYTGGVSSLSDELKRPGQVKELINGMTDPTFGLMKRPGLQFFDVLQNIEGDISNGHWFFINRDPDEVYFGVITEELVQLWNAIPSNLGSFVKATVEYPNDVQKSIVENYLNISGVNASTKEPNYDVLSIQDLSYIVNRSTIVEEVAAVSYTLNSRATVRLVTIDDMQPYTVTIDGTPCTWAGTTSYPDANQDEAATSADVVLSGVKKAIEDADVDVTVTQLATSLELTSDSAFTIDTEAGQSGQALEVFQDEIGNIARLPSTTVDGRLLKIVNTVEENSSYFVDFEANDGVSGTGIWKECRGWDTIDGVTTLTSSGLDSETMPMALINTGLNTFTLKTVDWTERLVGNLVSNSSPSFVNNAISRSFAYNNRLGMLSTENIIMSVAGEFENFYYASAQTVIASDPIDLSCSSLRPAKLQSVVTQAEGLVLFSDFEQFVLFAEDGNLTPSDAILRSVGNFQNNPVVEPQKIGNNIYFLNKGQSDMKCYGMASKGLDKITNTVDIGKIVSQYISGKVDLFATDPQNSMLILSSRVENDVYFYRYFNNGEKDVMQSWFKWNLPGPVQTFAYSNDLYFFICKVEDQYVLCGANINKGILETAGSHPRADFFTPLRSAITYDAATNRSIIPIPFPDMPNSNPVALIGPSLLRNNIKRVDQLSNWYSLTSDSDVNEGGYILPITREGGVWYAQGDQTSNQTKIVIGWEFNLDVYLPKYFYRNPRTELTDFTASLILSRYKFSCATTGEVSFFTKQRGAPDWISVQPVTSADYYLADNLPVVNEMLFTLPLYQRNKNFDTRIVASSPFPFTLNSMMWEGQYTPQFYSRS